jgi:hypothetical protein
MNECFYCKEEKSEEELRPYGPNGERVCFDCAMATPERRLQTDQNFKNLLGAYMAVGKPIVFTKTGLKLEDS